MFFSPVHNFHAIVSTRLQTTDQTSQSNITERPPESLRCVWYTINVALNLKKRERMEFNVTAFSLILSSIILKNMKSNRTRKVCQFSLIASVNWGLRSCFGWFKLCVSDQSQYLQLLKFILTHPHPVLGFSFHKFYLILNWWSGGWIWARVRTQRGNKISW